MNRTNSALNSAASATGKAAGGLARWAATDHINKGRSIQFIPSASFIGALWNIFMELVMGIFCAVLTGAIAYVMIAYGIPLFISLMLGD